MYQENRHEAELWNRVERVRRAGMMGHSLAVMLELR